MSGLQLSFTLVDGSIALHGNSLTHVDRDTGNVQSVVRGEAEKEVKLSDKQCRGEGSSYCSTALIAIMSYLFIPPPSLSPSISLLL